MTAPSRVRLGANECPSPPPRHVLDAIVEAAARVERYPDAHGDALRERLGRLHGVAAERIALGNGASELIDLAFAALVPAGGEVVICEPTFPLFRTRGTLAGARIVSVPARAHVQDLAAMARAVGPETRLVVVVQPNNPTGTIVRRDAWRAFLAALPPGLPVLCDEAYADYVRDPEAPDVLADVRAGRPVISLRTFSKSHALAGLRIGYAVASEEVARGLEALRPRFSVNALAQAAACAALDDRSGSLAARERAWRAKDDLAPALERLGVEVVPSETNFLLVRFPTAAGDVCAALALRGVEVFDLRAFGMAPGWARITIGEPAEHAALLAALAGILGTPGSVSPSWS
jgi:histidinol-phosphate aminotransferase